MDYLTPLNKSGERKPRPIKVINNTTGVLNMPVINSRRGYQTYTNAPWSDNLQSKPNILGRKVNGDYPFATDTNYRSNLNRGIQIEKEYGSNNLSTKNSDPNTKLKRYNSQKEFLKLPNTEYLFYRNTSNDLHFHQDYSVEVGGIVRLDKRINNFNYDNFLQKNLNFIKLIQRIWKTYKKLKSNKLINNTSCAKKFADLKFESYAWTHFMQSDSCVSLNCQSINSFEIINSRIQIPIVSVKNEKFEILNKKINNDKFTQYYLSPRFKHLELEFLNNLSFDRQLKKLSIEQTFNKFYILGINKIPKFNKLIQNYQNHVEILGFTKIPKFQNLSKNHYNELEINSLKKIPKFEILSKNYNDSLEIKSLKKIPKFEILTKNYNDTLEIKSLKKIPKFEILSKNYNDTLEIKSLKKIPKFEILSKNYNDELVIKSIKKIPKFEILSKNYKYSLEIKSLKKIPKFEILSKNYNDSLEIKSLRKIGKFEFLCKNYNDEWEIKSNKKIHKFEILSKNYNDTMEIKSSKKIPKFEILSLNYNDELEIISLKKIPKFENMSKNYNEEWEIKSIKKIPKFEILSKNYNDSLEIKSLKKINKFEILSKNYNQELEIISLKKIPKFEIISKNYNDTFEIKSFKKIPNFGILSKNYHDTFEIKSIKKIPIFEILSKNHNDRFEIRSIKKILKFERLSKNYNDKLEIISLKKITSLHIGYINKIAILGIKKIPKFFINNKLNLEIITRKKQNLNICNENIINIDGLSKIIKLEIYSDSKDKINIKSSKKVILIIENNMNFDIKGLTIDKSSLDANTTLNLINKHICHKCNSVIREICNCQKERDLGSFIGENEAIKSKNMNVRLKLKESKEEDLQTDIFDKVVLNKQNNYRTDQILNSLKSVPKINKKDDLLLIFEKNKLNIEKSTTEELKLNHAQNLLSKSLKRNTKNHINLRDWDQ